MANRHQQHIATIMPESNNQIETMKPISYYYTDFFDEHGDPRVEGRFLLRTPWPVIAICLSYLIFVLVVGPRLMSQRKPFKLFIFIRVYNLLMIAYNLFSFIAANYLFNYGLDTIGCQPIDPNARDWKSMTVITFGQVFLYSRLIEFIDTFCFVLRKKTRQVSNFHLFHHFSAPIAIWFFVKFAPGGNSVIFPMINTLIHTIMYLYYFLATFEWAKPFLFWKKFLTQMQIIQFILLILHSTQPLFMPDCKFPTVFLCINIFMSVVFICLFTKFYIENYGPQTVRLAKNVSRRMSHKVQSGVRRLSLMGSAGPLPDSIHQQPQQLDHAPDGSFQPRSGNLKQD